MDRNFNLVVIVSNVVQALALNNDQILKASTCLLNLARSFERLYPSLTNLRKISHDVLALG